MLSGKRVVLAGAGLQHQQLVELATPMLQHLPPAAAAAAEPASQYVGGHVLLPGEAPHTNLILAFEYPGGWRDIQVCVGVCDWLCYASAHSDSMVIIQWWLFNGYHSVVVIQGCARYVGDRRKTI